MMMQPKVGEVVLVMHPMYGTMEAYVDRLFSNGDVYVIGVGRLEGTPLRVHPHEIISV